MTITVLQENLQAALSIVQKALPSKPPLPILSTISFVVRPHECQLSATDLYFGITSTVQVQADEEGSFTVPGKQLRDIISALPPGKITLSYSDGTLKLTSQTTKSSLQCQSDEEYPQFPQVVAEPFSLSSEQLQQIDRYVGFSASSDVARPVLTTILCSFSENARSFVATDGFRLAIYETQDADGTLQGSRLLIPSRALGEVLRIMGMVGAPVVSIQISDELKQAVFTLEGTQVYVRMIDGEYPPYEKIIPSSFTTEVTFSRQELEDNIKRALIFARESSNIIRFHCEEQGVSITASSASLGTYEGEVVGSVVKGKPAEIAFNARYVLEYLQAVGAEHVWFGMTESLKPALFTTPDLPTHRYIIMPFKVNG